MSSCAGWARPICSGWEWDCCAGRVRPSPPLAPLRPGPRGAAFLTGALTNLLNPKVGVFYVSFLPQFVPAAAPVAAYTLLLGAIHVLLGLIWFACLIAATQPLARWLGRAAVVRVCDRLTGGLFIAFGVGLALQSRRPQ